MKPTMTEEERILTLEEKVARLQFDVYALQSKMDLMAERKDEPQKSCSTCGYSPQTPSCDTCEGYSNWWSLEDEPQTDCAWK